MATIGRRTSNLFTATGVSSGQREPGRDRPGPLFRVAAVVLAYTAFYTLFFSTILFSDRLLGPGDAFLQTFPSVQVPRSLWTPLVFAGYPHGADPHNMAWYPPAWIPGLLPEGWSVFMVLGYVLASSFACAFVRRLTGSLGGGFVAGLVYGMCGFMMAHLTHPVMVHSGAWLPAMLLCIEAMKEGRARFWLPAASLSTAMCVLAGAPQIFFYCLLLTGAYALLTGWRAPVGTWRFYGRAGATLGLGIGLCALQWMFTAALIPHTPRQHLGFADFASYSLPAPMLPILLFPYGFGAVVGSPYQIHGHAYAGPWNLTELSGYVGLVPLLLAALATWWQRRQARTLFWAGVAVLTLLLALGDAIPLGKLAYQVPGLNLFRAQGRHFMVFGFAIAVLAGCAAAAMGACRDGRSWSAVRRAAVVGPVLVGTTYACLVASRSSLGAVAPAIRWAAMQPWRNPCFGVPIALALLSAAALWCLPRLGARWRSPLLACFLIVELGSFGWFYEWQYNALPRSLGQAPPALLAVKAELDRLGQRLLPIVTVRGILERWGPWLSPDLNVLWGIPCVNGYKSLQPSTLSQLLQIGAGGAICGWNWALPHNRALDILSVRYVLFPPRLFTEHATGEPATFERAGVAWATNDLEWAFGRTSRTEGFIALPSPRAASGVALVTCLVNGRDLADGQAVLELGVTTAAGEKLSFPIVAGRDTADEIWEHPDLRGAIQHRLARPFTSRREVHGSIAYSAHDYVATIRFDQPVRIAGIRLRATAGSAALGARTMVRRISLLDEASGQSQPIDDFALRLSDPARWRVVAQLGAAMLLENRLAMPRAWLVPETVAVEGWAPWEAILHSRLPDGRTFDPTAMAVIEDGPAMTTGRRDAGGEVQIVPSGADRVELIAQCRESAFLVLSDGWFPGWQATVDGHPVTVHRTNLVSRGVFLSAGEHRVVFTFRPWPFYVGLAISSATALVLLGVALGRPKRGVVASPHQAATGLAS